VEIADIWVLDFLSCQTKNEIFVTRGVLRNSVHIERTENSFDTIRNKEVTFSCLKKNSKTASFGVSVEPKRTTLDVEQLE
jgi:hypothetical protein